MTENGYINATFLGRVMSAKLCLRDVTPEVCESIPKEEYEQVIRTIGKWEGRLIHSIQESNE